MLNSFSQLRKDQYSLPKTAKSPRDCVLLDKFKFKIQHFCSECLCNLSKSTDICSRCTSVSANACTFADMCLEDQLKLKFEDFNFIMLLKKQLHMPKSPDKSVISDIYDSDLYQEWYNCVARALQPIMEAEHRWCSTVEVVNCFCMANIP